MAGISDGRRRMAAGISDGRRRMAQALKASLSQKGGWRDFPSRLIPKKGRIKADSLVGGQSPHESSGEMRRFVMRGGRKSLQPPFCERGAGACAVIGSRSKPRRHSRPHSSVIPGPVIRHYRPPFIRHSRPRHPPFPPHTSVIPAPFICHSRPIHPSFPLPFRHSRPPHTAIPASLIPPFPPPLSVIPAPPYRHSRESGNPYPGL